MPVIDKDILLYHKVTRSRYELFTKQLPAGSPLICSQLPIQSSIACSSKTQTPEFRIQGPTGKFTASISAWAPAPHTLQPRPSAWLYSPTPCPGCTVTGQLWQTRGGKLPCHCPILRAGPEVIPKVTASLTSVRCSEKWDNHRNLPEAL